MNKIARLMAAGVLVRKEPALTFYCTTTGAATLTIAAMTVITGKTVTVDWGDGSNNVYTAGTGARTHNYAGAGTFTVKITPPTDISVLNLSDNKITLNSAQIKLGVNITDFRASGLKAGRFDSADVSAWRPTYFYMYSMPSGYLGTFNSSDISAWRPTYFMAYSMPSGFTGIFNSSDISAWRPTVFYYFNMLYHSGTFNSSDISAWTPNDFRMYSMASGYLGTFNFSHVSSWNPTSFHFSAKPSNYTVAYSAGNFSGFLASTLLRVDSLGLSQATIDQILADCWTAFATRTATGGTINVGGTNAAPSGTLQAANPPTTGKEYAYELVNDSQNINPTKKWTTVTITA